MNKKQSRKIDWNIILTGISAIAAIISMLSAIMANRITQESQLPRVSVNYIGQFADYDNSKVPCKNQLGYVEWHLDSVFVFDITNFGGKPLSLVGIDLQRDIETFASQIQATADFDYFGTRERFDKWLQEHPDTSFAWLERSKDKLDYSGPPINIGVGETHRIVLSARENVRIDKTLSPQTAIRSGIASQALDFKWDTRTSFRFADGSILPQTFFFLSPFSVEFSKNYPLTEFPICNQ